MSIKNYGNKILLTTQPHIHELKHVLILLCEFYYGNEYTKIFIIFSYFTFYDAKYISMKNTIYDDVDHVMTSPCFGFLIDVIL